MIGRNHCYVVNSCELVILVLSLYVKCCLLFSVSVFSIFQPKFDTAVLKLLVKRKTPVNVKNPNNPEIGAFQQMALSCLMVTIFLVRSMQFQKKALTSSEVFPSLKKPIPWWSINTTAIFLTYLNAVSQPNVNPKKRKYLRKYKATKVKIYIIIKTAFQANISRAHFYSWYWLPRPANKPIYL